MLNRKEKIIKGELSTHEKKFHDNSVSCGKLSFDGEKFAQISDGNKGSQIIPTKKDFQTLPPADVYYCSEEKEISSKTYFMPTQRQLEIEKCSDSKVILQKTKVWKLLCYALETSFNLNCREITFQKSDNGKWTCDKAFFSLSHTSGCLAVAVSQFAVGIDVERANAFDSKLKLSTKILTEREASLYNVLPQEEKSAFLLKCWTAKESYFKKNGLSVFAPKKIDSECNAEFTRVTNQKGEFIICIVTDFPLSVKYLALN